MANLVCGSCQSELKIQTTLVDAFVVALSDRGSIPLASTKTKPLVIQGVFVFVRNINGIDAV